MTAQPDAQAGQLTGRQPDQAQPSQPTQPAEPTQPAQPVPPAEPTDPPPPAGEDGGGGSGPDDPGAVTTESREWKLHWLKEGVTALLGVGIVAVTLWLLVETFFTVETRVVTSAQAGDPVLSTAIQLAHQQAFEQRQTVLAIAIGLVGVVTGYFFGRVPVERRAQVAENSARTNASAAEAAVSSRDDAQRAADSAAFKLNDVRATVDRMVADSGGGGLLGPDSATAEVELVALRDRMGWR